MLKHFCFLSFTSAFTESFAAFAENIHAVVECYPDLHVRETLCMFLLVGCVTRAICVTDGCCMPQYMPIYYSECCLLFLLRQLYDKMSICHFSCA